MPLGTQLAVLAALCAGLCAHAAELPSWALVAAILIGMALAARIAGRPPYDPDGKRMRS